MRDSDNRNELTLIPRKWFENVLDNWKLVLAVSLLGSLVGLIFSWINPAKFEAEAVFGININYGVTEPLELVVEDRALNRVAAVIISDDVLDEIVQNLPDNIRKSRDWESLADLRGSLRLDRRLAEWGLVVVDVDPQVAAEVADLWANVALQKLDDAISYGVKAALLLNEQFGVECYALIESDEEAPVLNCVAILMDMDPETIDDDLLNAIQNSRGILPNLSYEYLQTPTIPTKPILWERGLLVFAGSFVGLILSFGVSLVITRRKDKA
jgi:hypothetical protein